MNPEMFSALNRLVSCLARETALRRAAYPGMVNRGKLSRAKAHEEIAAMDAATRLLILLRDHPGSCLLPSRAVAHIDVSAFYRELEAVALTPIAYNPKETATNAV